MKLIPASMARWTMRTQSSWSALPIEPNIIVPRQKGLTLIPVAPRTRFSIATLLLACAAIRSLGGGLQRGRSDGRLLLELRRSLMFDDARGLGNPPAWPGKPEGKPTDRRADNQTSKRSFG